MTAKKHPRRAKHGGTNGEGHRRHSHCTELYSDGQDVNQADLLEELARVSELPEVMLEVESIRNYERAVKLGIFLLEPRDWRVA